MLTYPRLQQQSFQQDQRLPFEYVYQLPQAESKVLIPLII